MSQPPQWGGGPSGPQGWVPPSTRPKSQAGLVAAIVGGAFALTFVALAVGIAVSPSQEPPPTGASASASSVRAQPGSPTAPAVAPMGADPDVVFREYMRALAPHMPAVFGVNEAPDLCAQIEESAAETAPEALDCVRRKVADAQSAVEELRAVQPPPDFRDRHAALVAFANEAVVAGQSYAAAFESAVPRLERIRRHEPLFRVWERARDQENTPQILEDLDARASGFGPSMDHRLAWLFPMHRECNQRLRCVRPDTPVEALRDPAGRNARGVSILQSNCECIRVWATQRGEARYDLLTAR